MSFFPEAEQSKAEQSLSQGMCLAFRALVADAAVTLRRAYRTCYAMLRCAAHLASALGPVQRQWAGGRVEPKITLCAARP